MLARLVIWNPLVIRACIVGTRHDQRRHLLVWVLVAVLNAWWLVFAPVCWPRLALACFVCILACTTWLTVFEGVKVLGVLVAWLVFATGLAVQSALRG